MAFRSLTVAPKATETTPYTFMTSSALLTFSGGATVVTTIWKLLQALVTAPWSQTAWVPVILSLLYGAFLLYLELSTPKHDEAGGVIPLTTQDKVTKTVIAFINSVFLAASALGIENAISS